MAVNLKDPDSENPKRKRKRRKLLVHEKVEVRSVEVGFHGSWHAGIVIACRNRTRRIKYDNILSDDCSDSFVEDVKVSPTIDGIVASNGTKHNYRGRIRPLPPRLDVGKYSLPYGLCVDAFVNEAWWEGVIFDLEDGSEERNIFFPDMGDEQKIGIDLLRITQDWDEVTEKWERRGNWLFLELIEEYEKERPLTVSVKQIWYDLREKEGFEKVGEWTYSNRALWKELVLESINDNLALTVIGIYRVLDSFGDFLPEAQPPLELPAPDHDIALEPEANLADTHAVVLSENNHLLESDMVIDYGTNEMTLLDRKIKVVDKRVENGRLATGLLHTNLNSFGIQPIEEKRDLDGLISVMEDDGSGMNLVTNSNASCHDKAICVQHQAFSALPSNLDGISSISSNINSERFTSISFRKLKPKCLTRSQNPNWLSAGPNILPGAEFCPGAITEYALASVDKKKPDKSLTMNVRKHLSYLGWKIEFMIDKGINRKRYTSPDGKYYNSLIKVCQDLKELAETLSPVSLDDQRSLPTSLDDLSSYPFIEQAQVSEEATAMLPPSYEVVKPEYCPQAVVDWYMLIRERKHLLLNQRQDMSLKAKMHLSAVGWVFWYINKQEKRELRYNSPNGKTYYTLHAACKSCMDEGGVSENKSTDVNEEAEVHLASDKLSSAIISTEFDGSLVPESLPSEKQLTLYPGISESNELVELCKVKVQGFRKLRNKIENSLLHLAFPSIQSQTQADLHARQYGFTIGLIGDRKRRHPKDQNASFPNSKKRKVSRALIKFGVDGSCPPRVLRSSKRARKVVAPGSTHQNPRTVLSWLIDNNVVLPRAKVYYRGRQDHRPMAKGRITRDGIKCSCCQKVFTLTGFEVHAGSRYHRPAANIFLVDGRSLLECQMQIIGEKNMQVSTTEPRDRLKGHQHHCNDNDYICSVCHYGGELILCDQCPSSFHKSCLGLKDVPEGDWFCPSCCCGICGQSKFNENTEHHMDNGVLNCDQCEHQYHVGCLRKRGLVKLQSYPKGNWFCNTKCEKIFVGLQKLLGKPVAVGVDNLTWTLLKSTKYDSRDLNTLDIDALTENYSKLNVALGVMHECFEPVKEAHTRRDLVEDVIFSRGSNLNRLNFRGFYTVLLERNDELISVATVRVYGEKVAEVPLVGTRFQYRRLGMCRILMNELEKKLMELGVERLILPAVSSVLHTWTTAFGFSKMTDSERLEFLDYTFLDFQGTTMCQKLLKKIPLAEANLSRGMRHKFPVNINGSGDNIDVDGYSAVSEVFQAEQIEESEIVNQGSVDISVGNGSHGSTDAASPVVVVTQPTHLECKSCKEICLESSDEDANHKKESEGEGGSSANGDFKYYKRRKLLGSGSQALFEVHRSHKESDLNIFNATAR